MVSEPLEVTEGKCRQEGAKTKNYVLALRRLLLLDGNLDRQTFLEMGTDIRRIPKIA